MISTLLRVAILACLVAISFQVEVSIIDADNSIDSHYIVVFQETSTLEERNAHFSALEHAFASDESNNKINHRYNIGSFYGFAAKLTPSVLELVKNSPIVKSIEQDAIIKKFQSCSQQTGATWGLNRIADQEIYLDGTYDYNSVAGSGVDSYVIDTGINIKHTDFGGRAIWGNNFIDTKNDDCNGHGTHVAGTMGGKTYGVAKKTTLIAVKVLDCNGSGSYAAVIAGVDWTVTSMVKRGNPSVANMSLGGPKATAVNDAVKAAVKAGVTFVVAAGNENDDSCDYSPASTADAITVGATAVEDEKGTEVDVRTYFSNYGKCVTVFAPGLQITSTWIGSTSAIMTISGTSMASPHVAGMSALYLGVKPSHTPAQVKKWLVDNSSTQMIQLDCTIASDPNSCNNSPNLLVYSPCSI